jgi:RNA polymerase sigma factor (sigma-70 family)
MSVACRQHDESHVSNRPRPSLGEAPALRIVPKTELNFELYVGEVARAVAFVANTFRLSAGDAEELASDVWVKLLDREARVLRRFRGRARIGTYLVKVARNLLLDRRNKEWGRWRPSSAARRTGAVGVALDRLLTRDGLSLDAAEQSLKCAGIVPNDVSLSSVAALLPVRQKRTFVDEGVLESLASDDQDSPGRPCSLERARTARGVQRALDSALATLSAADRQLLSWRFVDGLTIAAIAPLAGLEARTLYRRFDKIMGHLRHQLEARGVDSTTGRWLTEAMHSLECALRVPPSMAPRPERKLA